jgi:hypothetical protein
VVGAALHGPRARRIVAARGARFTFAGVSYVITQEQLAGLFDALGEKRVLSVYLSSDATDPADRRQWRLRFEQRAAEARRQVERDAPDQLAAFDRALTHVERALASFEGFLPGKGWMGFATREALHHAETLRGHAPEALHWGQGPRVGPYVRNLKLGRPLLAALVDAQEARLYVMRDGEVEDLASFTAPRDLDGVTEGMRKGSATTSGVRGETRRDAAARVNGVETERMLAKAAHALTNHGDAGSAIVLGGTTGAVSALRARLPGRAQAVEVPGLHMGVSRAELKDALKGAASALNARRHNHLVDQIVETARARGRAVLGPEATATALRLGAVDTLVVSRGFLSARVDDAETLVDRAIEQGADVEELGGVPAERLDGEAGGAAARLRFPLPSGA